MLSFTSAADSFKSRRRAQPPLPRRQGQSRRQYRPGVISSAPSPALLPFTAVSLSAQKPGSIYFPKPHRRPHLCTLTAPRVLSLPSHCRVLDVPRSCCSLTLWSTAKKELKKRMNEDPRTGLLGKKKKNKEIQGEMRLKSQP